ncbi:24585_t:CDS:2 [Dentiscutata erythropus]|uniref:24585_t:CDS:1 n=1 Tax=Dentiscutata erythropus TaxID=1348616 RepID=A0A9N9CCR0_9GLOM|nr:24585_t:CDS:2 [Dentiscutata erythropus]
MTHITNYLRLHQGSTYLLKENYGRRIDKFNVHGLWEWDNYKTQFVNINLLNDSALCFTITTNIVGINENEIHLAKQELLSEYTNEVDIIQESINQSKYSNPMSA